MHPFLPHVQPTVGPSKALFVRAAVLLLSAFFFPSVAIAAFAPGETLDPGCAPTDPTCVVVQVSVDTTTNNFGIGTTSPYAKLSVVGEIVGAYFTGTTSATSTFGGGINLSGGCFALNGTCISGSGGSGTVGSGIQGQFGFYNSAGTALTATSSIFLTQAGNFGVGTTVPTTRFEVSGASSLVTNPIMRISSTGSQAPYAFNVGGTDQAYVKGDNSGTLAFGALDDIAFEAGGFGDAFEKARLTSTGWFGIGTTTPSAMLAVAGGLHIEGEAVFRDALTFRPFGSANAKITDSAFDWMVLTGSGSIDDGTNIAIPYADNGDHFYIGYGTTQNDILLGATGEELVVKASGNVGIGTSTPYSKLSVAGTVVAQNFNATSTTATSTFAGGFSTGSLGINAFANGNVGIGTTSPYSKLSIVGQVVAANFIGTTTATSTFGGAITTGTGTSTIGGTLAVSGTATSTFGGVLAVSGVSTSTFAGGVQATILNITSTTATSTFARGINLSGGCFAISGTCVGGAGGGSGTVSSGTAGQMPYYAANGTTLTGTTTLTINTDGTVGIGGTGNGVLHGYDDNAAGALTVRAGDGNGGGNAIFRAGDGATGGNVTLRAGSGNSLSGGNVTINAGDDSGGGTPGTVTIRGGEAGVGGGGAVTMRGGDADTGGAVTVRGGDSTGSDGGDLILRGGIDSMSSGARLNLNGGSGGAGGNVELFSGAGEGGSSVTIYSANGGTTGAGDVTIYAGNAGGSSDGDGGDINIYGGALDGAGRNGNVYLAWTGSVARGDVLIGTTTSLGPLTMNSGAYVTTGGTWTNASSRSLKDNFTDVDADEILEKINGLWLGEWNYKAEDAGVKHIGPIAEDFHAAFDLGGENGARSVSSIDPAGVALVGIQALTRRIDAIIAPAFDAVVEALADFGIAIEQGILRVRSIFAEEVITDRLCLEDVCVTKEELQALLVNAGIDEAEDGGNEDGADEEEVGGDEEESGEQDDEQDVNQDTDGEESGDGQDSGGEGEDDTGTSTDGDGSSAPAVPTEPETSEDQPTTPTEEIVQPGQPEEPVIDSAEPEEPEEPAEPETPSETPSEPAPAQ